MWATLSIYVGIRIYANFIDFIPDSVEMLSKTNIGILGGFLSFFLVLFVNQTNGRFLEMYGFSKACAGRIQVSLCNMNVIKCKWVKSLELNVDIILQLILK